METYKPTAVSKSTIVNLDKAKLPPQAVDLEEAILGAMMLDNNGLTEAMELLTAEVFYKDCNKLIFEAISELFSKNKSIDLLTISNELKRTDKLALVGGDFYLIQLTQKISSSAHIEYHSRIILQKWIQRKCISISSEIIEESYEEDADALQLLENAYREYGGITDLITLGKKIDFRKSVRDFLNTSSSKSRGVPSSLTSLDKKLNGYQNSDLIILAARPGMGKTAMVLNEVLECGLRNIPVAFFSLEMSEKQIIGRMLSTISGIDVTKVNQMNLTHSETIYLKKCADMLSELPIYIDDTGGISPIELKIKANKLKRENGVKMIVVDYLQLMKVKNKKVGNREQEISEISQSLKNLAKELDVPLIALSQLSRSVEQRGANKRPLLSDLRESGSIEQDADVVMFIYRPEYYRIEEWDDDEHSPTYNQAEIEVAKYRNGETGFCRVGCELKYMRFMDIEHLNSDITGRYFRNGKVDFELETNNTEIPKINPNEAFAPVDFSEPKNKLEEDNDIPF
jgi:replicative DNA helicase